MMNVIIAGGTGFLGRRIAARLLAAGHRVSVLTRRPQRARLPEGATAIEWDPALEGAWRGLVRQADAVVNLCGEGIADGRWSAARKTAILESRIQSTRSLVSALKRGAVLLNASAVGFYGGVGGGADEGSPRGEGFLADVCSLWETEALRAQAEGARVVLLRIGVVLGRTGGALPRMLTPFKLGLGGRLGSGRQWFPWIHEDDVARIVERCLSDEGIRGPINAAAPQSCDNAGFTDALGRALRRPTLFAVPEVVLRLLLGEMSSMLLQGRRIVPAAILARGYAFAYPDIDSALRNLLEAA